MHGCSRRVREVITPNPNSHFRRPLSQLGINLGDAHIIRNAGGLAFVIQMLNVFHLTDAPI